MANDNGLNDWLLDPATPETAVESECRALGVDPDAVAKRGADFVHGLDPATRADREIARMENEPLPPNIDLDEALRLARDIELAHAAFTKTKDSTFAEREALLVIASLATPAMFRMRWLVDAVQSEREVVSHAENQLLEARHAFQRALAERDGDVAREKDAAANAYANWEHLREHLSRAYARIAAREHERDEASSVIELQRPLIAALLACDPQTLPEHLAAEVAAYRAKVNT